MRFEVKESLFIGLVPTEDDRRQANEGTAAEASTWRQQLNDCVAGTEAFTAILDYETTLVESRTELASLESCKQELDLQHNELLAQRSPAGPVQKLEDKIGVMSRKTDVVAGRIRKLQVLLDGQFSAAAPEVREAFDHTFALARQENAAAPGSLRRRFGRSSRSGWNISACAR